MNDKERNHYNTFVSVRDFGTENTADFPAGSAGANNFASVGAAADEMEQSGANAQVNTKKEALPPDLLH